MIADPKTPPRGTRSPEPPGLPAAYERPSECRRPALRCVDRLSRGVPPDAYDILDNWKAPGVGDIKGVNSNALGSEETSVLKEFKPGK